MTRFSLLRNVRVRSVWDCDGDLYDVIVDETSRQTVRGFELAQGYIRCRGRRYIGTYGKETPVYAGDEEDVYYAHVSFFDGTWSHGGKSDLGIYHYHTEGPFFQALEDFAREQGIEAK